VAKHRFKKFERSENPPGFRIGETDLKILKLLADCRFLDSRQITAFFRSQSSRNIKKRLQFLYHGGYIERPGQQMATYKLSDYLVYSLGKKGASLVSQDKGKIIESKPSKEVGVSFMRHSLMISDFRLALEAALKNNGTFKLAVWREMGAIDAVHCDNCRLPIAPDAFFAIDHKDFVMHFFLEADRSTMTLERVANKFKGYWYWKADGGHTQKIGINSFRVLTICLSDERAENLRQVAAKANGRETGSDMFWFARANAYDLQNPENILAPIWRSAKGGGLRHLLE
jgi:hypothetical protein